MLTYRGMTSSEANHYRNDGTDAYGNPAERAMSDGVGTPCRHCLQNVPDGEEMLVFAYRPFDGLQPYAETGPIFLCASNCAAPSNDLPPVLTNSPDYLVKGYSPDQRIVYGTGQITPNKDIAAYAIELLGRDGISFVDVRSARNNCWLARVTRD